MSREFKVANCWKERKLLLKMYLIEQKSIYYQKSKKNKYKEDKNVNKCGRWTVQNRAVVALNRKQ